DTRPGTRFYAPAMVPGQPPGSAPLLRYAAAALEGGHPDGQPHALENGDSAEPCGFARPHADPGQSGLPILRVFPLERALAGIPRHRSSIAADRRRRFIA